MNNINNNNCNNLQTQTFVDLSLPNSSSASSSTYSGYTWSPSNKPIPKDIHTYIFSFFSQYDCARSCAVNNYWNQSLIPLKWPRNLTDYCSELVTEKVLTLGEMGQFLPMIQFLEKSAITLINNEYHVKEKNPELGEDFSAKAKIPNGFFKYGNLNFWISNSTDITIEEKGKSEFEVIKGEAGKMLVALAVDRNYLFALRQDGLISQWNYQTKQLVKSIETAYFKRDQLVLRELGYVVSFSTNDTIVLKDRFYKEYGFIVQKGFIILYYNTWESSPKTIELISLTDFKSEIIQLPSFDGMIDMKISNGKLILRGSQKISIYV